MPCDGRKEQPNEYKSRVSIRLTQSGLDKLGHSPGASNGLWGLRTARAMKSLLADGLTETRRPVTERSIEDSVVRRFVET